MSYYTMLVESKALLQELGHEAEYYATKGMCEDDFAYYSEYMREVEQHIAYLNHMAIQQEEGDIPPPVSLTVQEVMEALGWEGQEGDDVDLDEEPW
jgi:hypothetical protein